MPNWLAGERKTFSRLVIEGGDEIGVGGREIPDVEEGERVQRVDDPRPLKLGESLARLQ